MTAILQQLRKLDERHRRGEIDAMEYGRLRAQIKGSVEEADAVIDTAFVETAPAAAPRPARASATATAPVSGNMTWGLGLVICLGVIGLCMGLALMLFVDVSFGMTLGVTLLAALTVALFRNLEEDGE